MDKDTLTMAVELGYETESILSFSPVLGIIVVFPDFSLFSLPTRRPIHCICGDFDT